jgi:tetratricopeptide (TPR) repeat protein
MMQSCRSALVTGAIALALTACASRPTATPTPEATGAAPAKAESAWPLSTQRYRTTSGVIYLGNLDARIEELDRLSKLPGGESHRVALARNLYHRYRVVGRLDDAERALGLLDTVVSETSAEATAHQLRAVVLGGFHRFQEALTELERAAAAGAVEADLRRSRVELQLGIGDYVALAPELAQSDHLDADFHVLAHRADLRLQLGDPEGAAFRYRAAQSVYDDVNPVPLAWLHVQQGIALLRHGDVTGAREFFAAAHERLPQYYLATEHLAECEAQLGRHDRARELYRQVIAQTGNPEFVAALSGVEREAGNVEAAERLAQDAERGYAALIERHPAAFGQHAAEFFIERGDVARAESLARANLAQRQDVGSWLLSTEIALARGNAEGACTSYTKARQTGLRPPELVEMQTQLPDCGG